LLIPETGTPQCDGASCPGRPRHRATVRWQKLMKRAAEAVDWEKDAESCLEWSTFRVAVVRERRKWGAHHRPIPSAPWQCMQQSELSDEGAA
jgi:hypothetical protein